MGSESLGRKFRRVLIKDRNVRMVKRIIGRTKQASSRSFFFAIGAGHFYGETGIVALLEEKGFEVTRLSAR